MTTGQNSYKKIIQDPKSSVYEIFLAAKSLSDIGDFEFLNQEAQKNTIKQADLWLPSCDSSTECAAPQNGHYQRKSQAYLPYYARTSFALDALCSKTTEGA